MRVFNNIYRNINVVAVLYTEDGRCKLEWKLKAGVTVSAIYPLKQSWLTVCSTHGSISKK